MQLFYDENSATQVIVINVNCEPSASTVLAQRIDAQRDRASKMAADNG